MYYKYNCNLCNYRTNHRGNYSKHNDTKKHIIINKLAESNGNLAESNGKLLEKNKKKIICNYCNKIYTRKTHLKEHYKICKDKIKHEEIQKILDDKNKLKKKYIKNKKKLKELETDYEELETDYEEIKIENEELEKEYNDFLKKTANNLVENKATSITNNNTNNILNMHYVINNFTDAPNFSDQITGELTDSQKEDIIKCGPLTGCVKLINMKCVEDKKANERSIHCLDPSRKKFMIRVDDNWQIDLKGKKMLTISIPITKDIFEKDFDFDNMNDPFMKSEIINKLIQLEQKTGHVKITSDLTNITLLKNN